MSYSNKTQFYKIPCMKFGDMLTQQDELQQMSIIDNLLYAATFGADKCIIEDGKYSLQQSDENKGYYRVKVQGYGMGGYACLGILNYRLYRSKEFKSPYFGKGYFYVYICYTFAMNKYPDRFTIQVSKDDSLDKNNSSVLKICQVDYRDDKPVLKDDINKVYAKNVLAHTQDKTNPHGENLIQKNMEVTDEFKYEGHKIYPCIYDVVLTNDIEGVQWKREGYTPKFVTCYGQERVGQIWWKIEGDAVTIYNNGEKGKKLQIKVDVEKKK